MVEIRSHTALRGIAAILVMLGHFRKPLKPAFDVDQYSLFLDRGYVWVDLFFILSGFILCYVYGTRPGDESSRAVAFLRARFARIYPLHFAALLFLLTLRLANGEVTVFDWKYFFQTLFLVHAWGPPIQYEWNPATWSISVEFAAYLLFIPFCFLLRRLPIATLACIVLMLAVWFIYPLATDEPRSTLARCLPIFFLGTLIYQTRAMLQILDERILSLLQIMSVASILAVLHFGAGGTILVLPFAVLVFSTQTDIGILARVLKARVFAYLGALSYSIYILHIPMQTAAFMVWQNDQTNFGVSLMIATALAVTMIASHYSYYYFEMPTRRFITGRHRLSATPAE